MFCQNCGNRLPDDAIFCPECGSQTINAALRCPLCGTEITPGAPFCGNCGQQLSSLPNNTEPFYYPPGPAGTGYDMPPPDTGPKIKLTWSSLLKQIGLKTGQALLKSLPLTILFFLISLAVHTYLLVGINQGFSPDTWLGQQLLGSKGNMISATVLWTLFSTLLFSAIYLIKRKGAGELIKSIIITPKDIAAYVTSNSKVAPAALLTGAGFALLIAGLMSGTTNLVLAIGVSALFATGVGRLLSLLIRSTWNSIWQVLGIKNKQIKSHARIEAYLNMAGAACGFVLGVFLFWDSFFGLVLLGVAAALMFSGRDRGGSPVMPLFILFIATLYLFFDPNNIMHWHILLADDGGEAEVGGWANWWGSQGSYQAAIQGVLPSIGMSIGPSVGSALNAIDPDMFDFDFDDDDIDWYDTDLDDMNLDDFSGDDISKDSQAQTPPGENIDYQPPSIDTAGVEQAPPYTTDDDYQEPGQEDGQEPAPMEDETGNDQEGYDKDGYDSEGYDRNGFDRNGFDRRGYDQLGFDKSGYDEYGYNRDGYNRDGYDRNGQHQGGYDKDGFDTNGYDRDGYDRSGYNREGYDRSGFDKNGRDQFGYDRDGFDSNGYNREGYGRDGYNAEGYDRDGYNKDGYNWLGLDRDGFDKEGYDQDGYDRNGLHRDGYDQDGFDKNGYDRNGYDKDGFNHEGFDKDGYDKNGYDKNGFDRDGFDAYGRDKDGYDKNGFDNSGYDRNGFDKDGINENGYDKDGYDRYGYDKDNYDRDGYNMDGYNKDGYDKKGFDQFGRDREGYDSRGFDKNGFDKNGYNESGFNKDGYNKDGLDFNGHTRVDNLRIKMDEIIQQKIKEGYYVKNAHTSGPIQDGLTTGLTFGGIKDFDTIRKGWNNFPTGWIEDWVRGMTGGQCGEYARWGQEWMENSAKDIFGDGTVTGRIALQRNPWVNHAATLVITPDGERLVLDFWDGVQNEKAPQIITEKEWLAKWDKELGEPTWGKNSVVDRGVWETTLSEDIQFCNGDVEKGIQRFLGAYKPKNPGEPGYEGYMQAQATVKSFRREPWESM